MTSDSLLHHSRRGDSRLEMVNTSGEMTGSSFALDMLLRGAERRRSACSPSEHLQSALNVTIHQRLPLCVPQGAVGGRHTFHSSWQTISTKHSRTVTHP